MRYLTRRSSPSTKENWKTQITTPLCNEGTLRAPTSRDADILARTPGQKERLHFYGVRDLSSFATPPRQASGCCVRVACFSASLNREREHCSYAVIRRERNLSLFRLFCRVFFYYYYYYCDTYLRQPPLLLPQRDFICSRTKHSAWHPLLVNRVGVGRRDNQQTNR